jgi:hypothetical protein
VIDHQRGKVGGFGYICLLPGAGTTVRIAFGRLDDYGDVHPFTGWTSDAAAQAALPELEIKLLDSFLVLREAGLAGYVVHPYAPNFANSLTEKYNHTVL